MPTKSNSTYGESEHYLGQKGQDYFALQNPGKSFAAKIYEHKFLPYIKSEDTVIDFGCGGGQLLARYNCKRKIGVDLNPMARNFASTLGLECYQYLNEIPDNIADVVISHHALEHVEFPIGALREIYRKLKPGGLLVLCVPIDNWRLQNTYDPKDHNHHLHTWTKQLLGNTLFEAGYEIVAIKYRVEGWTKKWTVFLYGRFPKWFFYFFSYLYGIATGTGRELLAVAKKP
jgi:SAM-dependent methyltransferase